MTDTLPRPRQGQEPGDGTRAAGLTRPGAHPDGGPTGSDLTLIDPRLLDRVIQRIFTAGLALSGAADGSTPAAAVSIERAIGELDDALHDIREAAFAASTAGPSTPTSSPAPPPG
jgi:hypothetical protein